MEQGQALLKGSYVPGWDCHGLPIEQKALQAIGVSRTRASVSVCSSMYRDHT